MGSIASAIRREPWNKGKIVGQKARSRSKLFGHFGCGCKWNAERANSHCSTWVSKLLDKQVAEIEVQIKAWHRDDETSQKLQKVLGIGPITASAMAATVGDAKNFENGRQMAAWLGLVPRQSSSGGKQTLLGMSKRGDAYLRTLLIHGARSVLYRATQKNDPDSWLVKLATRRNANVAAVALANKTARIVWALLVHDREFRSDYAAATA